MGTERRLQAVPSNLSNEELLRWVSEHATPRPVSANNFAEAFSVVSEFNGKSRQFVVEAVTPAEGAEIAFQLIRSYYTVRNGMISREIWLKGDAHLVDSQGRKYPLYSKGLPNPGAGSTAIAGRSKKSPTS